MYCLFLNEDDEKCHCGKINDQVVGLNIRTYLEKKFLLLKEFIWHLEIQISRQQCNARWAHADSIAGETKKNYWKPPQFRILNVKIAKFGGASKNHNFYEFLV